MHGVVVAGQQIRRRAHLADVLGAVAVAVVVPRQVEAEPVDPAVAEPHLFGARDVAELERPAWRALCQISHAMLLAAAVGPEERDLVGQPVGEVVDMLDEPGEGVAQQFADSRRISVSAMRPTLPGS